MNTEQQLRQTLVNIAHHLANIGLVRGNDGNLSAKINPNSILITPSGIHKRFLSPDDLVLISTTGEILSAKPGLRPTSEAPLHLIAYQRRPDISSVIHAHPPHATAMTIAGKTFPDNLIPEVAALLGPVPTAAYATPGTRHLADSIRNLILNHDAILLSHHGSLTVASNPLNALILLERLEHAAQIALLAQQYGTPEPLPSKELSHLRRLHRRLRPKK